MDSTVLARGLTAMTLIFHIVFATLGVGIPLMISIAEWIGVKKGDKHYILIARRWARGFVVSVAVGVVTGTIIGLQLSLLWPSFMQVAGKVISLPLFLETFAFFFEAIFLGIYLYTWDRFKNQYYHWLISIPVVLGSTASAFFITSVNAFMNQPQGFTVKGHAITSVTPLKAMFNPATPTEVAHVVISAYLTSAFVLASITAVLLLNRKHHEYYKKALKLTLISAFIFSIFTVIIGDLSGKYLAHNQPEKLAAGEWHFKTTDHADLLVLGFMGADKKVKYAITIPSGLSLLAYDNPNAVVKGLDQFPKDEVPPLWIHYMFNGMVLIGGYLVLIPFLYLISFKSKRLNAYSKWFLWLVVLGGPLAIISIECGWIYAEVGRQPWILYHVMKTSQGATTSSSVGAMFILFFLLYVFLGTMFSVVMMKIYKNEPAEVELEYRYNK